MNNSPRKRVKKVKLYEQGCPHSFAIYCKNEATKLLIIYFSFYLLINTKRVHGIHLRLIQLHMYHVIMINNMNTINDWWPPEEQLVYLSPFSCMAVTEQGVGLTQRRGSDVILNICQRTGTHRFWLFADRSMCVFVCVCLQRETVAVYVLRNYLFKPVMFFGFFLITLSQTSYCSWEKVLTWRVYACVCVYVSQHSPAYWWSHYRLLESTRLPWLQP